MPTLHIEHAITDVDTWVSAFGRFAAARQQAGVRSEHVRQPVDDPNFVVIDLGFETSEAAAAFLDFLNSHVWAKRENSPGLAGDPEAKILQTLTIPSAVSP